MSYTNQLRWRMALAAFAGIVYVVLMFYSGIAR